MSVVLALDQGTTSSRALVFDHAGRIVSAAQREITQHFPEPGWVEHDPLELWRTTYATAAEALERAGAAASDVAAIGIANQRETTLLWERSTGKPVANAIVWQDRRTSSLCERLKARGGSSLVAKRTGLVVDPYFSATKIAWLLERIPGLRERCERGEIAFGTVDSWLIWNLTGGKRHVTDMTNASRTLLFDIHRLEWSDELLALFGVPREMLPGVLPCTADFGLTDSALFGAPVRIAGAAGDQQAALAGQAGFIAGAAKNTYGTGSFAMLNTGERPVRSAHGLLTTLALALEPRRATYALEGSVFGAGAAVQWLRDGLRIIDRAADVEELARSVPDAGGLSFVPAFTGLGAPYWDPHARGTLTGITGGTTRAHIARATLEAIAHQSADVIRAMERDAGLALEELRVDGGGSANDLTMQMQADLLGVPVVRPRVIETTALGAAYLAGLQIGFWPDLQSVSAQWMQESRFMPAMERARQDAAAAQWRRAVSASRV